MERDNEVRARHKRDEAAGRRGRRAVLRPAGQRRRRQSPTSAGSASSTRRTTSSRCCSTGGHRRRGRSTPRPARTRRACGAGGSSTPAGGRWSRSPTRSSAGSARSRGDVALLAALNAPRGDGMRDIVATIQSEQDAIIRLDHPGVLVIEGGPGTGKTVVALHRVAYLLYTQRERMERHGVLVVGPEPGVPQPHRPCAAVAGRVGRGVLDRPAACCPDCTSTAEDAPDAARLKGSRKMVDVLAAASPTCSGCPRSRYRSGSRTSRCTSTPRRAEWARQEARDSGCRTTRPARCSPTSSPTCSPSARSAGSARAGSTRSDKQAWEEMRRTLSQGPRRRRRVRRRARLAVADRDAGNAAGRAVLVARAAGGGGRRPVAARASRATRGRCRTCRCSTSCTTCWAGTSVKQADDRAAEQERRPRPRTPSEVLDSMVGREDHMDDEDHLFASDMLVRRGPGRPLRGTRHPHARRTRRRGPRLDLPARGGRRGPGTVRNGLAGADAPLPRPFLHGGRRPGPAPFGGGRHVVGRDARPVRAGPLGLPVADGELPHPGRDHGRRGTGARRVRAGRPGPGIGARQRCPAVVPAGHAGRASRRHRGVRAGGGRR